jgi:uncharacterized Rmd1/YagE family protein
MSALHDRFDEAVSGTADHRVRALLIGHRLNLRALDRVEPLAISPLTMEVGARGRAMLFRFGAVVFFNVSALDEAAFLQGLEPFVVDRLELPETESLDVRVEPRAREGFDRDILVLPEASLERWMIIADVLAKSVLLADYEQNLALTFDRVEPLADSLQRRGHARQPARELLKHIGGTLQIQHRMVGRAAVGEKPEILWEHPELERLFHRLETEYEIKERQLALERKLDLIGTTAHTLLDLLQNKRSLRVEWYIVLLIVAEIVLTLYELFIHGA